MLIKRLEIIWPKENENIFCKWIFYNEYKRKRTGNTKINWGGQIVWYHFMIL